MKPQSEMPRSLGKVLQLSLAYLFTLALAVAWPVLARRSPAQPQGTPPTITVATPINRTQGSAPTFSMVASVNDAETPRGNLVVTAIAPSGIVITNLTNVNGQISASVAANCEAIAGANTVILTVTDGDGLKASANFIVNVTANTTPELFDYPATTVELGTSKTIFPTAPPTDNGTINLTATISEGFTGTLATNSTTGAVTVNNAGPLGDYTVTVTAIDNCAALATRSFALSVRPVNTAPTITAGGAVTRQQGSAASVATIALVNDGQSPPGDLIVTASAPAGLTISNISNSRGTITASVAAGCNATLGANTVVLTVSDGSLTATANLTANVTANTPPSLGSYGALSAKVGANAVALPRAAPADNGTLTSLTASISSGFNGTLSVNPSSGVVTINNAAPAGTYTVTVRATDNCGATATATFQLTVAGELTCVNPRAGLVSWYRAEGNANDFKAANNGALQNGVGFAPGQVGQAFSFNGTNEVVIPNSASLNPQQFTFEGWVNPTQLDGGVDLILNKEDEPFTIFHYELGIRGNSGSGGTIPVGNLAFALNGVAGLPNDFNGWVNGGGAVPLNTWTHVALAFDGTSARTYLNGVLARSVEGLSGSLITSTGPLKIGSRSNSLITQAPQDRFNGLIDELSLYNRALSDQEIQAIFNANRAGKCTVPLNTPPQITATPPLTVQQGSPATSFTVATVNDEDTAAGDLTVTVVSAPSGLTLSNIANANGTITANVAAACNATVGANTVNLQVSDGNSTSTTTLTVQVSANAPPVLGNYASPGTLELGSGATVTPTGPPADNGGIASLRAIASGVFTGSLSINPNTGAVTISNARPGGNYTVTITATDNCGLSASTSFSFAVNRLNSTIILTASAPPYIQGQPVTLAAMVLPAQASAFTPSGTVTFFDGTTMLGTAALDAFGKAALTTTALEPGARGVTAVYNGDGNFNGATSAPLGLSVARAVANVSAASFRGETLAPEQIVAAFGTRLATTMAQAQTLPLPTTLGGTVVRVRDSTGRERNAALFYVSPTQVSYLMPGDLAIGSATVTVLASDGTNSLANVQIARSSPGIFTADSSGRGLPAAQVLRVLPNGSQRLEPVAVFDQAQRRFVAVPIDLGAANEQVFLILYGTGWRLHNTAIPVTATLGGVSAEVQFIGSQTSSSGLDQVNLRLPRALIGRGEVDVVLTIDSKPANTVRVNVK
jgi:uncharacterized protein (TIGR03437 family)